MWNWAKSIHSIRKIQKIEKDLTSLLFRPTFKPLFLRQIKFRGFFRVYDS